MSLLPASNGPTAPPSAPRMQPAQIPGSSSYAPQPIPPDTHFNNLRHPDMFNNADSFPLSTFNTLQGSRQGMDPHPSFLNDQAPSDVIWPGTNPTALPPDGSSQYISSNQSFQAACTCPTCLAHRFTAEPFQFGGGQPAPAAAGQDSMTSSGLASSSSTSRRVPAAPLVLPPAALDASMHYPSTTIDSGLIGFTQPTADSSYARRSNSRRRVRPVRDPRRGREVPFVRVKDRVKWVRRDLMKMTLWFSWSPDAEVEAYGPWDWDDLSSHLASPADGVTLLDALGTEPAPDVPPPVRRSG